jgi:hypothetical protein
MKKVLDGIWPGRVRQSMKSLLFLYLAKRSAIGFLITP